MKKQTVFILAGVGAVGVAAFVIHKRRQSAAVAVPSAELAPRTPALPAEIISRPGIVAPAVAPPPILLNAPMAPTTAPGGAPAVGKPVSPGAVTVDAGLLGKAVIEAVLPPAPTGSTYAGSGTVGRIAGAVLGIPTAPKSLPPGYVAPLSGSLGSALANALKPSAKPAAPLPSAAVLSPAITVAASRPVTPAPTPAQNAVTRFAK